LYSINPPPMVSPCMKKWGVSIGSGSSPVDGQDGLGRNPKAINETFVH
jgi:hypothetical protein